MSAPEVGPALADLALRHEGLSALMDRFGEAETDRARRSLLISIITQAWHVHDAAASAYAALDHPDDADGPGRGQLT